MPESITDDVDAFDYGVDPQIDELVRPDAESNAKERIAVIRTSDRNNFRRCRRRWHWQSHLRQGLTPVESASPLWFGTGFHYAMEDFHGKQLYDHPVAAFKDYVKATYKQAQGDPRRLPYNWMDLVALGNGMLEYYADVWLTARPPLKTFVWKGVPQVEVHVQFDLPITTPHYDRVLYGATLDRIVEDEDGIGLWILDYKTAIRIQTQFLQTDPQISSYCWLAAQLYDRPIYGFIYQQHRKDLPEDPRIVSTGRISTAESLKTTHRHYRRVLLNIYGDVERAPKANIDYLNRLNEIESVEADKFIRRDKVYRNQRQIEAEGEKVLMEVEEMVNLDLPLYPNPTRECAHLCSFSQPCISLDDGSDWEEELRWGFRPKDNNFDRWRNWLPKDKQ